MKVSVPPLTPHERAANWVLHHHYGIGKIRQAYGLSYYAEPDGTIIESGRDTTTTVGRWRMEGFNIVIEIEDY